MVKMPVVSANDALNTFIRQQCIAMGNEYVPVFFKEKNEVIAHLKYEFPEITIIYFSDVAMEAKDVLAEIAKDPWLHYGGLIVLYDKIEEKKIIEEMYDQNVIALLSLHELRRSFYRLIKILRQNRQIIFQRGIHKHLLTNIAGSFIIDNDPLDITTYANLVTNYLYNTNLINKDGKDRLHVALLELLINAIEHGNCKISFDEKSAWLEASKDIMELIREKNLDPAVRAKKVYFSYNISPDSSSFTIRDEGSGFDWRARLAAKKTAPGLHGMGVNMTSAYVNNLKYNEVGNEVSFEIKHQHNETNIIPAALGASKETVFEDGQYVCSEGEESDNLFYIVSGTLHVYSKGKLVSALTPDDIFIGEMSFLLSNRRSATVVSKGKSSLIKISKQNFINLIKDNPHYGIFLARLLAKRLARLNLRTSKLNGEYLKLKEELAKLKNSN